MVVSEAEGGAVPIHDWTRVDAGLFHHFHQAWTISIAAALNKGVLPPEYFALAEQRIRGPIPDVLTLKLASGNFESDSSAGTHAVATAPPQAQVVRRSEAGAYAARANRIAVRHRHGDVVAVLEIVSPGNKATRAECQAFVRKSADLVRQGVHLLIIDPLPPGKRDPEGLARAVWDEFEEEEFQLPPDRPLTLAAIDAGPSPTGYLQGVKVGERLPDMPLFLEPETYVPAPLEATYQTSWDDFPAALKGLLEESG
jgi:hypothetical protein